MLRKKNKLDSSTLLQENISIRESLSWLHQSPVNGTPVPEK